MYGQCERQSRLLTMPLREMFIVFDVGSICRRPLNGMIHFGLLDAIIASMLLNSSLFHRYLQRHGLALSETTRESKGSAGPNARNKAFDLRL